MRTILAVMVMAASIAPSNAYATGAIECHALDGEASIGESAIISNQAFGSSNEMRIDFTDTNVERIIAELRLFSASEGHDVVTAGTLKIAEVGAFALNCTRP